MRTKILAGAAALAIASSLIAAAPADARNFNHGGPHGGWHGGGWHGGGWRAGGWRGGGWRGGGWYGPGLGFAAGALIGGAFAAANGPYYGYGYGPAYAYEGPYEGPYVAYGEPAYDAGGDAVAYCQQRFRSYDPASGTYLGYDGMRHSCP